MEAGLIGTSPPVRDDYDTENLGPAIDVIVKETKAGYKTTEFYVALGASVLTILEAYPVPDNIKGIIVGAIAAIYVISRGLAKQGVPEVETSASVPLA